MKINKLIVPLLGVASLTSADQQEIAYLGKPQALKTAKLIMGNCPINYWTEGGDWATFGCVGHLSQFNECLNIWYNRGVHVARFSCLGTEIDLANSVVYACPINTEVGGGLWASFGCVGQLTFGNECENIWWNDGPKSKKITCDRFDFSKRIIIYRCPYDDTAGVAHAWVSVGCIGQYSHTNRCYNFWWDDGPRSYYRECEAFYIPNKKDISLSGKIGRKEVLQDQQQTAQILHTPPKPQN